MTIIGESSLASKKGCEAKARRQLFGVTWRAWGGGGGGKRTLSI